MARTARLTKPPAKRRSATSHEGRRYTRAPEFPVGTTVELEHGGYARLELKGELAELVAVPAVVGQPIRLTGREVRGLSAGLLAAWSKMGET